MGVSGLLWGNVRGSGNDDSSNSVQVQQSMAGWSIAQNPLLLSRDQPCNVLGNFCKGLTYCQQRNLSFHVKTQVHLTRSRRRVNGAVRIRGHFLQTYIMCKKKKKKPPLNNHSFGFACSLIRRNTFFVRYGCFSFVGLVGQVGAL